jgi:hypothetical protein
MENIKITVLKEIFKALKNTDPSEQDKSVFIKLTPDEIFNIAKMGATYWYNAKQNNTTLDVNDVCHYHVDIALSILKHTDPDRFINQN